LQPDTTSTAPPTDAALPEGRPRTTLDLAEAKLRTALQERSGYVVVTADSAADAEALFTSVEPKLTTFRCVRASGRALDPEAIVRSLWCDGEAPFPARLAMRTLIDDARTARRPIVVAITEADAAEPAGLERVRLTLEGSPDAAEIVRIVLLGGPALIDLLRRPETRAVAMRIGASVSVPSSTADVTTVIVPPTAGGRYVGPVLTGLVAVAAALLAWTSWPMGDTPKPTAIATVASIDAAPPVAPPAAPATVIPAQDAAPVPVAPVVARAEEPAVAASAKEPEPPAPEPASPATSPEPTPPSPQATSPPVETSAPLPRGAAIQIGAFARAESAEALRRKLAPQFPTVYISPMERGSSTLHRVRVGGFRTEHDLGLAAAVLRTAGYPTIRVRE
jgi:cell division septation protein DedD